MKKILILSPYDGFSHRFWRESLAGYLGTKFIVVECVLPPRFFSWRHRGNSLSFSRKPELQQSFDLIIATSMTDLSALRGLNRNLAMLPAVLYFHENQFAYPGVNNIGLLDRQITSVYSALSAEKIVFNSEFNRTTFLNGVIQLLKKMPDEVPRDIVKCIEEASTIIPVPLDIEPVKWFRSPRERVRIVWNHRWEHDKGPASLLEIVNELLKQKVDFEMSLLGQQFSLYPSEFDEILQLLRTNNRSGEIGFVEDRNEYLSILASHHFVLSTADQEFQGLAIQEGIATGCIPVAPDCLCYPEYIPPEYRYSSPNEALNILNTQKGEGSPSQLLKRYLWPSVGSAWDALLAEVC